MEIDVQSHKCLLPPGSWKMDISLRRQYEILGISSLTNVGQFSASNKRLVLDLKIETNRLLIPQ